MTDNQHPEAGPEPRPAPGPIGPAAAAGAQPADASPVDASPAGSRRSPGSGSGGEEVADDEASGGTPIDPHAPLAADGPTVRLAPPGALRHSHGAAAAGDAAGPTGDTPGMTRPPENFSGPGGERTASGTTASEGDEPTVITPPATPGDDPARPAGTAASDDEEPPQPTATDDKPTRPAVRAASDDGQQPHRTAAGDESTRPEAARSEFGDEPTSPEAVQTEFGDEPTRPQAALTAFGDEPARSDRAQTAFDDGPTRAMRKPVEGEVPVDTATPSAAADPEQARSAAETSAVDDEPTRPLRKPEPMDGGQTMRLQPPFFAPGTTRTPRVTPPGRPREWHAQEAERDLDRSRDDPEPAGSRFPPGGDEPERSWERADRERPDQDRDHGPDRQASWERSDRDQLAEDPELSWERSEEPSTSGDPGAKRSPDPVTSPGVPTGSGSAAGVPEKGRDQGRPVAAGRGRKRRRPGVSSAGALIWVLLALLGFTLVVQLRSNDADAGLATARQEDLVGILSDLEARDQRLQQEINQLEESQRQLTSGVAGRQAALAEAGKRADELGLLSGTMPARGPGLKISIDPKGAPVKASSILNAVQELRGAGGEVMEIVGDNGVAVRIVASSYFIDGAGGQVLVDGKQLSGPYTLWVIGVPATMQTALQIPGGVVASVSQAGGNVTMEQRGTVEVTALRQPTSLQYARPVS